MKTTQEIELNILKAKRNKIKNYININWDKFLLEIKDKAVTFCTDNDLVHSFENRKIYNVKVKILDAAETIKNIDLYATVQLIEIKENNKNHILAQLIA